MRYVKILAHSHPSIKCDFPFHSPPCFYAQAVFLVMCPDLAQVNKFDSCEQSLATVTGCGVGGWSQVTQWETTGLQVAIAMSSKGKPK